MPVTGQQVIARNLIRVQKGFIAHANKTMDLVRKIVDTRVQENMSLTDHSLEDLAKLDHPYASRHGDRGSGLHDPYYQVHQQSGNLLGSKTSGVIEATVTDGALKVSAYVALDPEKAPYAVNVVYGTSKMIPRPLLSGSKDEVINEVKTVITNEFKNLKFDLE